MKTIAGVSIEEIIDREQIEDKTAQILIEAESIEDIKEYLARIHNIDLKQEEE